MIRSLYKINNLKYFHYFIGSLIMFMKHLNIDFLSKSYYNKDKRGIMRQ